MFLKYMQRFRAEQRPKIIIIIITIIIIIIIIIITIQFI